MDPMSRAVAYTFAPSSASASTSARPIPLEHPVTRQVLPTSRKVISDLLRVRRVSIQRALDLYRLDPLGVAFRVTQDCTNRTSFTGIQPEWESD
jgi:hypothetical protein